MSAQAGKQQMALDRKVDVMIYGGEPMRPSYQ